MNPLAQPNRADGAYIPLSLRKSVLVIWLWQNTPIPYTAARKLARFLP